jgi:hypothetical protein
MGERKLQTGRYERTLVSTPVFFFSTFSSSSPQEEEDDAAPAAGRARARTIFPLLPDLSGFHSPFLLPCPFLSCLSFLLPSSCPVWFLLFFFPRLFTY